MTWLVVILGLVLLIFIHEVGHFSRRARGRDAAAEFYIGFPPALVKVRRNGIEYGIGAIPLGGYVRIPGMHRPAARDVEASSAPALREEPELVGRRRSASGARSRPRTTTARARALPELEREVESAQLTPGARRSAERGAARASRRARRPTRTGAQPTWKRVAVIVAGPAANILVAFVIFFAVFAIAARRRRPRRTKVGGGRAEHARRRGRAAARRPHRRDQRPARRRRSTRSRS